MRLLKSESGTGGSQRLLFARKDHLLRVFGDVEESIVGQIVESFDGALAYADFLGRSDDEGVDASAVGEKVASAVSTL